MITFATSNGGVVQRYESAFAAVGTMQHLGVLLLTIAVFVIKLSFDYIVKLSREHVNTQEQNKKTSLIDVDTSNDMKQLVEVLETLKQQLKQSQDNEIKAKNTAKESIARQHNLQTQLDEINADCEILRNENQRLREQLQAGNLVNS